MKHLRGQIALLLLILISVFMVPRSLWHQHDHQVKVEHQDCGHDAHIHDQAWDCTLCQLNTTHYYLAHQSSQLKVYPSAKAVLLTHKPFASSGPTTLPFSRGPPSANSYFA